MFLISTCIKSLLRRHLFTFSKEFSCESSGEIDRARLTEAAPLLSGESDLALFRDTNKTSRIAGGVNAPVIFCTLTGVDHLTRGRSAFSAASLSDGIEDDGIGDEIDDEILDGIGSVNLRDLRVSLK